MNAVELSEQLLNKVKLGLSTDDLQQKIEALSFNSLTQSLKSQEDRLAFWLNLYNAFFQIIIKNHREWFSNKIKLFMAKHFDVAGRKLSLDDIEHNMLRRSTYKWSLGYLRKPFPSKFEGAFQVFELDPRIHFAMNCGAISCPPIRFYTSINVQEQLEIATIHFLEQEVIYDEVNNTVNATSLFSWFRGDFGGIKGIKSFLITYELIPNDSVKIKFTPYNWTSNFENFIS